jgi:hypothetical protein
MTLAILRSKDWREAGLGTEALLVAWSRMVAEKMEIKSTELNDIGETEQLSLAIG